MIAALFAWLISHWPAVLFSKNKPASTTFLSEQTSQHYFSLRTNQHQTSAASQTNSLSVVLAARGGSRGKEGVRMNLDTTPVAR
jgi:hypothetical protein